MSQAQISYYNSGPATGNLYTTYGTSPPDQSFIFGSSPPGSHFGTSPPNVTHRIASNSPPTSLYASYSSTRVGSPSFHPNQRVVEYVTVPASGYNTAQQQYVQSQPQYLRQQQQQPSSQIQNHPQQQILYVAPDGTLLQPVQPSQERAAHVNPQTQQRLQVVYVPQQQQQQQVLQVENPQMMQSDRRVYMGSATQQQTPPNHHTERVVYVATAEPAPQQTERVVYVVANPTPQPTERIVYVSSGEREQAPQSQGVTFIPAGQQQQQPQSHGMVFVEQQLPPQSHGGERIVYVTAPCPQTERVVYVTQPPPPQPQYVAARPQYVVHTQQPHPQPQTNLDSHTQPRFVLQQPLGQHQQQYLVQRALTQQQQQHGQVMYQQTQPQLPEYQDFDAHSQVEYVVSGGDEQVLQFSDPSDTIEYVLSEDQSRAGPDYVQYELPSTGGVFSSVQSGGGPAVMSVPSQYQQQVGPQPGVEIVTYVVHPPQSQAQYATAPTPNIQYVSIANTHLPQQDYLYSTIQTDSGASAASGAPTAHYLRYNSQNSEDPRTFVYEQVPIVEYVTYVVREQEGGHGTVGEGEGQHGERGDVVEGAASNIGPGGRPLRHPDGSLVEFDTISYEDLLALQERIGMAPRGASQEDINTHTARFVYRPRSRTQSVSTPPTATTAIPETSSEPSAGPSTPVPSSATTQAPAGEASSEHQGEDTDVSVPPASPPTPAPAPAPSVPGSTATPPATAAVSSTPTASSSCPICLAEYEEGDDIRALRCLHTLHTACSDTWLSLNRRCPVCMTDFRDEQ